MGDAGIWRRRIQGWGIQGWGMEAAGTEEREDGGYGNGRYRDGGHSGVAQAEALLHPFGEMLGPLPPPAPPSPLQDPKTPLCPHPHVTQGDSSACSLTPTPLPLPPPHPTGTLAQGHPAAMCPGGAPSGAAIPLPPPHVSPRQWDGGHFIKGGWGCRRGRGTQGFHHPLPRQGGVERGPF